MVFDLYEIDPWGDNCVKQPQIFTEIVHLLKDSDCLGREICIVGHLFPLLPRNLFLQLLHGVLLSQVTVEQT